MKSPCPSLRTGRPGSREDRGNPNRLRYYNPVSPVLKDKGWLEQDLAKDGIKVRWILSLGSNKTLEYLNAKSLDFGSSAGSAALLARINGNPVYVYSRPDWTALLTQGGSPIKSVADLKGKRIAATRGTDPHVFLIRSLADAGLTEKDVKVVLLQHADRIAVMEPNPGRVRVEAVPPLARPRDRLDTDISRLEKPSAGRIGSCRSPPDQ